MRFYSKDHIFNSQEIDFNYSGNYNIPHCHDFWEFVLITSNIKHNINNKQIKLSPQNVLIIRPNDNHYFSNSAEVISTINIKLTDRLIKTIADSYSNNLYEHLVNKPNHITFSIPSNDFTLIRNNINTLVLNNEIYTPLLIHSVHVMIANYFLQLTSKEKIDYSSKISFIIQLLSDPNYFQAGIDEILHPVGLSHVQIYRLFKKETGESLQQFFHKVKMQHAAQLIASTTESIANIAQIIGYSTQSHFSKVFKQFYGVSPLGYRSQYQKNNK